MHKEFILGVEAFEYNIVIYQYNAIKGRSSSMSELHILSPVCLRSIFLSLSHLLPLLFTPCCFESVYECDSLCFSDSLCHRILDIALFVLHFDLLYDRCHSLRKYVNFHLISVQVLENARYSCFSPNALRYAQSHTLTRIPIIHQPCTSINRRI